MAASQDSLLRAYAPAIQPKVSSLNNLSMDQESVAGGTLR